MDSNYATTINIEKLYENNKRYTYMVLKQILYIIKKFLS